MNQRVLGIIAMACSPFLLLDFLMNQFVHEQSGTMLVFDLIYMTGWMCSIVALKMLKAYGSSVIGKSVLLIQMVLLSFAQFSNLVTLINLESADFWLSMSDTLWSISNIFMIVVGIAILRGKVISGVGKFVPLAMGLWLPFTGLFMNIFDSEMVMVFFAGPYSAVIWGLLGFAVYSFDKKFILPKLTFHLFHTDAFRGFIEKILFKISVRKTL